MRYVLFVLSCLCKQVGDYLSECAHFFELQNHESLSVLVRKVCKELLRQLKILSYV